MPHTSRSGRAATRADQASGSKLVEIRGVARWLGLDANVVCARWYLCRPVELSRAAAEEFLSRLKQMRPVTAGRSLEVA